MPWLFGVLITLSWGAGAFGSPYPWVYRPLLLLSVVIGLSGLWLGRNASRPFTLFIAALGAIAIAVALQLIPMDVARLNAVSPHALAIVKQNSLQFVLGESSVPISIEPSRTTLGLAFFISFALLLLGTARALTRQTATRIAGAMAILGAALAAVGIIQHATFNGKIYGVWELVQGGSPFGPFVNKNHFAGWMLMGLPVALGYFVALVSRGMRGRQPGFRNLVLWFSTEDANRAALAGFAIVIMALSLVLTMSRSGISALFVAILIAGAVVIRHERGVSRCTLLLGYFIVLMIGVVSWVGLDQIMARFAEADLASINERPAIWADTIRIVKDFWLTGTGLDTYGVSTLFYQTAAPEKHLAEAHSDYLQLASEGGLLLGIPIALAVLAFAREVRQRFREDVGSIWWIRMGAVIGLVAIALQSVVEFSLQMPGNAALFAVVAGLAIHDGRKL